MKRRIEELNDWWKQMCGVDRALWATFVVGAVAGGIVLALGLLGMMG